MPVLNEQSYLKTAVEAILRQEYQGPLRVVLALGPSTDRTNDVAEQLATADSRVTLVQNPSGKTSPQRLKHWSAPELTMSAALWMPMVRLLLSKPLQQQ